jgi:TorA maturation chaperone TorD
MQSTNEFTAKQIEIQQSIAASDMFKLLSMFLHLPTEEIAVGILDGSLADDVLEIFIELGVYDSRIGKINSKLKALQGKASDTSECLTAMRQEYTRLFTHPQKPVIDIYETYFLFQPEDGGQDKPSLFISPAALDAEQRYKQADLVKSKEFNEPGDHMTIELEFMAYLYCQLVKALQEDNQEAITLRNEQIEEFKELHLQKWAMDFFNLVVSKSQREVYQTIGLIGSTFLGCMLKP